MRLLILTQVVDSNDTNLGFFHRWIEKLAEKTDELLVVCLRKGEYRLPSNVTVLSLGKEHSASRWSYLRRLYRYIFREKYDAVFVHMNPEYLVLCGWWWRLTGKKVLLWYTHKAVNLRLRIAEIFATKIFTASKESFRLSSKKVEVVGHGIDVDAFVQNIQRQSGSWHLIWVGRITPVKDLETVICAVGELRKNYAVVLDVVGGPVTDVDCEYYKTIQELVREMGVSDVVHFRGSLTHEAMREEYGKYTALVHTSRTGSVDKVVLEAMAAGLPVFTSSEAYHSFDDLVVHFEANNAQNLAQSIEKNLNSAILYDTVKRRNFVREHHNLDALVGRIVAYFKS